MKAVKKIPEYTVPGGWVIGGITRLLDVWSPSPLIMWAPAFHYPAHDLRFTLTETVSDSGARAHRRMNLFRTRSGFESHKLGVSDLVFDCRHDSTGNVAHILQGQIAVALTALEVFGLEDRWRDLVFVVKAQTPAYAIELFEVLGFRVLATDEPVEGHGLTMEPKKFPFRAMAAKALRSHAVGIGLLSDTDPERESVFLSRRNRRTVTNMEEVEPLIKRAGFRTVYAEDLSAEDQIQTVANAGSVFGLHGAAMAFLMFRSPQRSSPVIEAFSCGYASNWARAICSRTGGVWMGIQGAFDPEVLGRNATEVKPRTFESLSYSLSAETVKIALATINPSMMLDYPGGLGDRLRRCVKITAATGRGHEVLP